MTKDEFIKTIIPDIDEMYKMYIMNPIDLIGKKVISKTSGFSKDSGGQIMLVDSVSENGEHIKLVICEDSILTDYDKNEHRYWRIYNNEKHLKIKLYNEKNNN